MKWVPHPSRAFAKGGRQTDCTVAPAPSSGPRSGEMRSHPDLISRPIAFSGSLIKLSQQATGLKSTPLWKKDDGETNLTECG